MVFAGLCCQSAFAEQVEVFPGFDVHHVVVNTLFLKPEIAARYGITRAQDRAIVNLSVLDKAGNPTPAIVKGTYKNLLSQTFALEFTEHREGTAIYHIAEIKYSAQDVFTFAVSVATEDGEERFEFNQRMYLERQR